MNRAGSSGTASRSFIPNGGARPPTTRGNDTTALRHTGRFISDSGGGRVEFLPGTYVVGEQFLPDETTQVYQAREILRIEGATDPVILNGNGAILKAEDGLCFGFFNPVTGQPEDITDCGLVSLYGANAYFGMIHLLGNTDVTVRDFELDGNIFNLNLGGDCPVGRQLFAYGIRAFSNTRVHIERVHSHHHGTDGIIIGYPNLTEDDSPTPHRLIDVTCEYNARQGLSWVGGIGLHVTRGRFNHTGRARFSSSPGAGVDIEAENAVTRDGLFEDSEFINNNSAGAIADSGDGGYTTFRNSVFWGTTNWALWARKPAMVFEDCQVHGSIPNAYGSLDPQLATQFIGCRFDDTPHPEYGVYRSSALLVLDGQKQSDRQLHHPRHRHPGGLARRDHVTGDRP